MTANKDSTWRKTMFYGYEVTAEQEVYIDSIESNILTICNAISGSGKTTLAVAMAHLLERDLLYLFNPTEEDKMGYRPGDQFAKDFAYIGPLLDALESIGENPAQCIRNDDLQVAKNQPNAWVEAKSHTFIRGTNLGKVADSRDRKLLAIIDEAQNWSRHELKKTLTRFHDDAIVVVIGHTGQIDLPDKRQSGFEDLIKHFSERDNEGKAQICTLTKNFRGWLSRKSDEM